MIRSVRPRAVVFDLDGTLIDSMPLVLAGVAHAIEPFGARSDTEIFARLGGPPERFLGTLLDDLKNVPVAVTRLHAYLHKNEHHVAVFDGANGALTAARDAGVAAAIWTGRDRASTERLLRAHDLIDSFAEVVCGDDLPTHKPDSEGLQEIMRRLGTLPAETLLIGDADVDVLGGAGVGVDTLLIRHSRAIEPHIVAKSWRTVEWPKDAFHLVVECVRAVA